MLGLINIMISVTGIMDSVFNFMAGIFFNDNNDENKIDNNIDENDEEIIYMETYNDDSELIFNTLVFEMVCGLADEEYKDTYEKKQIDKIMADCSDKNDIVNIYIKPNNGIVNYFNRMNYNKKYYEILFYINKNTIGFEQFYTKNFIIQSIKCKSFLCSVRYCDKSLHSDKLSSECSNSYNNINSNISSLLNYTKNKMVVIGYKSRQTHYKFTYAQSFIELLNDYSLCLEETLKPQINLKNALFYKQKYRYGSPNDNIIYVSYIST